MSFRLATLVAALAATAAFAPAAQAQVAETPGALVTTLVDNATVRMPQLGAVNCAPTAAGGPVTQDVNARVVHPQGEDVGVGSVTCNSTTANVYTVNLHVQIEHFSATGWIAIPGCGRDWQNQFAAFGVASVPELEVRCVYTQPSAYLPGNHRATATATVGTQTWKFASPPWLMLEG